METKPNVRKLSSPQPLPEHANSSAAQPEAFSALRAKTHSKLSVPQTVMPSVTRPAHHTLTEIDLGKDVGQKFAIVVDNVFTATECQALIDMSEALGFEQALLNVGVQVLMTEVRSNYRCTVDSEALAYDIWERVRPYIPQKWGNIYQVVGVNERLRILRYEKGQLFKPHQDGYFRRTSGERQGETSYITVQLYLNEEFEGGSTNFLHKESLGDDDFIFVHSVKPKTGSVLLFEHPLLHEGEAVTQGRKYVIRTDAMYTPDPDGPLGHPYEDPRSETNDVAGLVAARARGEDLAPWGLNGHVNFLQPGSPGSEDIHRGSQPDLDGFSEEGFSEEDA